MKPIGYKNFFLLILFAFKISNINTEDSGVLTKIKEAAQPTLEDVLKKVTLCDVNDAQTKECAELAGIISSSIVGSIVIGVFVVTWYKAKVASEAKIASLANLQKLTASFDESKTKIQEFLKSLVDAQTKTKTSDQMNEKVKALVDTLFNTKSALSSTVNDLMQQQNSTEILTAINEAIKKISILDAKGVVTKATLLIVNGAIKTLKPVLEVALKGAVEDKSLLAIGATASQEALAGIQVIATDLTAGAVGAFNDATHGVELDFSTGGITDISKSLARLATELKPFASIFDVYGEKKWYKLNLNWSKIGKKFAKDDYFRLIKTAADISKEIELIQATIQKATESTEVKLRLDKLGKLLTDYQTIKIRLMNDDFKTGLNILKNTIEYFKTDTAITNKDLLESFFTPVDLNAKYQELNGILTSDQPLNADQIKTNFEMIMTSDLFKVINKIATQEASKTDAAETDTKKQEEDRNLILARLFMARKVGNTLSVDKINQDSLRNKLQEMIENNLKEIFESAATEDNISALIKLPPSQSANETLLTQIGIDQNVQIAKLYELAKKAKNPTKNLAKYKAIVKTINAQIVKDFFTARLKAQISASIGTKSFTYLQDKFIDASLTASEQLDILFSYLKDNKILINEQSVTNIRIVLQKVNFKGLNEDVYKKIESFIETNLVEIKKIIASNPEAKKFIETNFKALFYDKLVTLAEKIQLLKSKKDSTAIKALIKIILQDKNLNKQQIETIVKKLEKLDDKKFIETNIAKLLKTKLAEVEFKDIQLKYLLPAIREIKSEAILGEITVKLKTYLESIENKHQLFANLATEDIKYLQDNFLDVYLKVDGVKGFNLADKIKFLEKLLGINDKVKNLNKTNKDAITKYLEKNEALIIENASVITDDGNSNLFKDYQELLNPNKPAPERGSTPGVEGTTPYRQKQPFVTPVDFPIQDPNRGVIDEVMRKMVRNVSQRFVN